MRRAALSILACPSCRAPYEATAHAETGGEILSGHLTCPACAIVVPIVQGFPLFTEPRLHAGQATPQALAALEAETFGTEDDYLAYRRRKLARGGMEIYAAFQPFNESTRALEPLLAAFAAGLRPGDYILDPWCRSGWSAEWLAGLFPEQIVVALWEGEKSVLGYRGFGHWLGPGRRSPNVQVMFVHPERALPFVDGAFGGVYALDALHRFSLVPFAGELLRVAGAEAAIALAHLHLSNSEPQPYFDRGGVHFHGLDYRAWADALVARTGRRGRVFSEDDLFEAAAGAVPAEAPDTPHYNGFVLLEPPAPRAARPLPPPRDPRFVVSPLFRLHFSRRMARVDGALHDGAVAELLERHPIYQARLPAGPAALDDLQVAILALALCGLSADALAATLAIPRTAFDAAVAPLVQAEVLRPTAATAPGVRLQRFHANQLPAGAALADILGRLAVPDGGGLRTSDGGSLSAEDAEAGLRAFAAWTRHAGLGPGKRLAIADTAHPLAFLLLVAALASGLSVTLGEAEGADLTVVDGSGPGRIAFGLDGAEGETVLAWVADHADAPPLAVVPGGAVTVALGDRRVTLDAELLAEAALSLAAAAEAQPGPLPGFGDLMHLLAALTHVGQGQGLLLRA